MGLYAYCILPGGQRPDTELPGLEDAPVEAVELDGLTIWASDLDRSPRPSIDAVRRHDSVVRAAMGRDATPLPLRFGHWFPSRQQLMEELEGETGRFRRQLDLVRGAVEFGVRVVDEEPAEEPAGTDRPESGTAYMEAAARRREARAERLGRGKAVAARLRRHLGELVREDALKELEDVGSVVEVAHLVAEGETEAYREKVEEFRAQAEEPGLTVTGPWPPYSFVERGSENERD